MPSILDLSRMGESASAGVVSQIAADDMVNPGGVVVTAARHADGRLRLISWRVEPSGSVTQLGDSGDQAGAASDIDIARVGGMCVSACRTDSGNLKLISWEVEEVGQITRRGDSGDVAGDADWVRIIGLRDGQVLTGCRTGNSRLKLISWRLNADGSLTRMLDSGDAAGEVLELQLVDVSQAGAAPHRVVSAVRDLSGDLKLIAWSLAADGSIARVGDSGNQAGQATLVRVVVHGATGQLVTAFRTDSGSLEVISWTVASTGVITRTGDSGSQAGAIGDYANALLSLPDGVVSAVRTAGDALRLIAWEVDGSGTVQRRGDSGDQAGYASLIQLIAGDAVADTTGRSVTMITALRTAPQAGAHDERLKLITWGPSQRRLGVACDRTPGERLPR